MFDVGELVANAQLATALNTRNVLNNGTRLNTGAIVQTLEKKLENNASALVVKARKVLNGDRVTLGFPVGANGPVNPTQPPILAKAFVNLKRNAGGGESQSPVVPVVQPETVAIGVRRYRSNRGSATVKTNNRKTFTTRPSRSFKSSTNTTPVYDSLKQVFGGSPQPTKK